MQWSNYAHFSTSCTSVVYRQISHLHYSVNFKTFLSILFFFSFSETIVLQSYTETSCISNLLIIKQLWKKILRRKLNQVEVGDIQHKNKLTPYLGRKLRGVIYRFKEWNYSRIGQQYVIRWMILDSPALLLEVKKCIPKRKASKVWKTFKICQSVVSWSLINCLLLEYVRKLFFGSTTIINTRSPLWSTLASLKIKFVTTSILKFSLLL